MISVYKNTKNEICEIARLKPCYANVILALNERAENAGYLPLVVEVYKDGVADPRYSFQSKGLMFRFKFEKAGQETTWEHWSFKAPAFLRGKLSGEPIRITIPTPTDEDEWKCKYEMI
jgi:hypothetical protein